MPSPTVKIDAYRTAAGRIIGAALTKNQAWERLEYLTDRIGNRLSGSHNLERAIAWAVARMREDGLDNVRAEKVMVPHWLRGQESLEMMPNHARLSMLGLGNSVGTPADGITAETIVVRNFDELDALGEKVRGKIVVYNAPFTNYGATVQYRLNGASRAAHYGAAAALVRSITPVSLQTPHTGAMNYDPKEERKIPVAAITIETAEMLQRAYDRQEPITVRLKMEAKFLEDAESANVIAELKGTERPDEIVLVGGHFDSWDVGQGAHDDGGSCIAAWEAIRLLKELGLRPRRTIRVVLFTNEENGLRGGNGYRDAHRDELPKHIFAIESDSGIYRPEGFGLAANAPLLARSNLQEIAKLLSGIDADRIGANGGGADIGPIMREGVVGANLDVEDSRYFDIHHTESDTLDKIDRRDLALCVATLAVMAYTVADLPAPLAGSGN